MGIIAWIVFGGLVGWVASKIMKTDAQQGIVANVVVGVLGAVVGGWIAGAMTGAEVTAGFDITSFLFALLGAIVLIWVYKLVTARA